MDTGYPSFIPEPGIPPKHQPEQDHKGPRERSAHSNHRDAPFSIQQLFKPVAFIGKQFLPLPWAWRLMRPAD